MAVTYGFYNSLDGDRKYDTTDISSIFDGIINDGIFMSVGTSFMVNAAEGMRVNVGIGKAWFNHTWTKNDSILPLTLDQSEVVLSRIDAVVLDINGHIDSRENTIKIIKGTPGTVPQPPVLVRSLYHNQYALAHIYIGRGVTSVTQSDITNKVGTGDAPFVTGILDTIDTTDLVAQWESQYRDWTNLKQNEFDSWTTLKQEDYNTWTEDKKLAYDTWVNTKQTEYDLWLDLIKDVLDENTAGNLLNMINATNVEVSEHLADYVHHAGYGDASGTNAKTIILNPVPTGYTDGMTIAFKNITQNSGAVTLNVNGKGAKSVLKSNGNALASGNLKANSVYTVRYNGINFILQGEGGEYGTATPSDVLQGKTIGTDDGLVSGTIPSKSAQTYTPGGYNQTIASGQYLTGNQTISGSSNLKAENIKSGVKIFNVSGSLKPAIGYNWITQTPPLAGKNTICLYSGNDIQMCVMYEDTVNYKPLLYTRTSTTNWVQRTIPFTQYAVRSIAYGQGLYVMTGVTPYKYVATSSDGISWTLRSLPFYYANESSNSLFYEDGLFIVSSGADTGNYATSTNGTSWTGQSIGSGTILSLVKGNGLWVMGISENIYTSTNGTSWVNRGKPFSQTHNVLSLGYGKGLYVAGGNDGGISTSTDGINWTQRTNLNGNVWKIVYNSGLYLAGTDSRLFSSEDGINWVQRFSVGYPRIAWGDLLLIAGNSGRFAYSSL